MEDSGQPLLAKKVGGCCPPHAVMHLRLPGDSVRRGG